MNIQLYIDICLNRLKQNTNINGTRLKKKYFRKCAVNCISLLKSFMLEKKLNKIKFHIN